MHFTFWEIFLYYFISLSLGTMLQVYLSYHKKRYLGKLLPLFIMSFDFYFGAGNFYQAFVPEFNHLIFIASLTIFVFLAIPAILFFFIDLIIKRKLSIKRKKTKQKRRQKLPYQSRP